jgi:hypothetical protein
LIYTHYTGYSRHKQIPFSVSGENAIILAQNLVIVGLIWRYNKGISRAEKLTLTALYVLYAVTLLSNRVLGPRAWGLIAKTNLILCSH